MPEDERNLLYVAITRARRRVQMSRQLYDQLCLHGHKFYRLVPTTQLRHKDASTSLTCCVLGTTFEPQSTVTLCRRRVKLVCTTHTRTHAHIGLTALCLGLPGWAGTRKVK